MMTPSPFRRIYEGLPEGQYVATRGSGRIALTDAGSEHLGLLTISYKKVLPGERRNTPGAQPQEGKREGGLSSGSSSIR
jgi:hypothetical protein